MILSILWRTVLLFWRTIFSYDKKHSIHKLSFSFDKDLNQNKGFAAVLLRHLQPITGAQDSVNEK